MLISLLSLSLTAPAAAQTKLPTSLLGFYTNFVRSMNPHLAVAQCEVYARDLLVHARRLRFDPALLAAIITVESHWNPRAQSRQGAQGLGQLMPSTAQQLGVDPRSGRDNLLGASMYLHRLLGEFRKTAEPLRYAVAGYNAGPEAVRRYGGIPPISETQHYVVKVMHVMNDVHAQAKLAGISMPQGGSPSFDESTVAYWGQ
jgi:soluble lytic murein transglycosylase-like protein